MKKLILSLIGIVVCSSYVFGVPISGYTLSPSSTSINGVYVVLVGSYSYTKSMYTTVIGSYNFTLYPGTYTITPTKTGYRFSPINYSIYVSTFATSTVYKNFFGINVRGAEYYKVVPSTINDTAVMYLAGDIRVGPSTSTANVVIDSTGNVTAKDVHTSTLTFDDSSTMTSAARIPTVYVAGSNCPTELKAIAKYVCDGTNDDVEIQQGLDYLNTNGGGTLLLEGIFYISSKLHIYSNSTMRGEENYTAINYASGGNELVKIEGSSITIRDIIFNHSGAGETIENSVSYDNIKIINNKFNVTTTGFTIALSVSALMKNISIIDNDFNTGNGNDPVYIGDASNVQILNNHMIADGVQVYGVIHLVNVSSSSVINNTIESNYYRYGIYTSTSCNNNTILGNKVTGGTYGYTIYGSSNCIVGNMAYRNSTNATDISDRGNVNTANSWNIDVNISSGEFCLPISSNIEVGSALAFDFIRSTITLIDVTAYCINPPVGQSIKISLKDFSNHELLIGDLAVPDGASQSNVCLSTATIPQNNGIKVDIIQRGSTFEGNNLAVTVRYWRYIKQ